ncbi:MAG: cell division protein ZapA [Gammaproteobacteria bacterium]
MSDEVTPVDIQVLGKSYRIACAEGEQEYLRESARYLDQKMREIRDSGKVAGLERIAVMAALNIAHELAQANRENSQCSREIHERLLGIQKKIDVLLIANESR